VSDSLRNWLAKFYVGKILCVKNIKNYKFQLLVKFQVAREIDMPRALSRLDAIFHDLAVPISTQSYCVKFTVRNQRKISSPVIFHAFTTLLLRGFHTSHFKTSPQHRTGRDDRNDAGRPTFNAPGEAKMTMTQCRDAIRGNSNNTGSRVLELLSEHGLDSSIEDETASMMRGAHRDVLKKTTHNDGSGKKYPY